MDDLVVAGAARVTQLQTVESKGCRQRVAAIGRAATNGTQRIELSHRQREQWINPEPRMVIEILVTQRQSMHALGEQLPYNMFDKSPITPVTEALSPRLR